MLGACRAASARDGFQVVDYVILGNRYHAHALGSRREVAHALRYLRANYRRHTYERIPDGWSDPYAGRLAAPRTWLLRTATVMRH